MKQPHCNYCGKVGHYQSFCGSKPRKPIQTRAALPRAKKPIKQRGKRSYQLADWVQTVARPYLIETYGEQCNVVGCPALEALDVDHKLNKGSRPDLKMSLANVQLLCRPHHMEKTDGKPLEYRNYQAQAA